MSVYLALGPNSERRIVRAISAQIAERYARAVYANIRGPLDVSVIETVDLLTTEQGVSGLADGVQEDAQVRTAEDGRGLECRERVDGAWSDWRRA